MDLRKMGVVAQLEWYVLAWVRKGANVDVTRERIRQIEAKALRKLRHHSLSHELHAFLDCA
jgi:hypothetical protein